MKNDIVLEQFFSELQDASIKKDFDTMEEIYYEIEKHINSVSVHKIFFSELKNDEIILPPSVANRIGKIKNLEALLYKKSDCLELHLTPLTLTQWQNDFLYENFSAKQKNITIFKGQIIKSDSEIKESLNIVDGDIIKFDLSNGIIISKFDIQSLWLSLNL